MGNVYNDNDAVDTSLAAGSASLGYTETGSGAGMDPEVSDALEAGNREADAEVDSAKDDADKTRKGSRDLADTDEENGGNLDGIGTELSAGEGGGTGVGGLSSPAAGMPAGGAPPMPRCRPCRCRKHLRCHRYLRACIRCQPRCSRTWLAT